MCGRQPPGFKSWLLHFPAARPWARHFPCVCVALLGCERLKAGNDTCARPLEWGMGGLNETNQVKGYKPAKHLVPTE